MKICSVNRSMSTFEDEWRSYGQQYLNLLDSVETLGDRIKEQRVEFTRLFQDELPALLNNIETRGLENEIFELEKRETNLRDLKTAFGKQLISNAKKMLTMKIPFDYCIEQLQLLKTSCHFTTEAQLELFYLECRKQWFMRLIETEIVTKRPPLEGSKLFEAVLGVAKLYLTTVVSEYGAVFDNKVPQALFLATRIEWIVESIRSILKTTGKMEVLTSYWNQVVILDNYLAKYGILIHPLVEDAFVRQGLTILRNFSKQVLLIVQNKLSDVDSTIRKENHRRVNSNPSCLSIPPDFGEYPALTTVGTMMADFMDLVRIFAIPAMKEPISLLCDEICSSLLVLLAEATDKETEIYLTLERELQPFLTNCVATYFGQQARSVPCTSKE